MSQLPGEHGFHPGGFGYPRHVEGAAGNFEGAEISHQEKLGKNGFGSGFGPTLRSLYVQLMGKLRR